MKTWKHGRLSEGAGSLAAQRSRGSGAAPAIDPEPSLGTPEQQVWRQDILQHIASFLRPNELACLRRVDRAAAELFRHHTTLRLSQPVPRWAFHERWSAPGACRAMTRIQRFALVSLTAASDVVPNLQLALEAAGLFPVSKDLSVAAGANALASCRWLAQPGRIWIQPEGIRWDCALYSAAESGHSTACEWCLEACPEEHGLCVCSRWGMGSSALGDAVAVAARNGHGELAEWLLAQDEYEEESHRVLQRQDLCVAALEGCELPVVQRLCDVYGGPTTWDTEYHVQSALGASIVSRTSDWLPKLTWLLGFPGLLPADCLKQSLAYILTLPGPAWREKADWLVANRGAVLCGACYEKIPKELQGGPEVVERFDWLLRGGCRVDVDGPSSGVNALQHAVAKGNLQAVRWLLAQGARPSPGQLQDSAGEAAAGGHLGVLEELKRARFLGVDNAESVLRGAAEGNHVDVLQWVLDAFRQRGRGGSGSGSRDRGRGSGRGSGSSRLLTPRVFAGACEKGSVEAMLWLAERGCGMDRDGRDWTEAVNVGCEAAVELLAELGCPKPADGKPYVKALEWGDLRMLPLLRRAGLAFGPAPRELLDRRPDTPLLAQAVRKGAALPLLRWLRAEGCPVPDWAEVEHMAQARAGHDRAGAEEVLAWLRSERRRSGQAEGAGGSGGVEDRGGGVDSGGEGVRERGRAGLPMNVESALNGLPGASERLLGSKSSQRELKDLFTSLKLVSEIMGDRAQVIVVLDHIASRPNISAALAQLAAVAAREHVTNESEKLVAVGSAAVGMAARLVGEAGFEESRASSAAQDAASVLAGALLKTQILHAAARQAAAVAKVLLEQSPGPSAAAGDAGGASTSAGPGPTAATGATLSSDTYAAAIQMAGAVTRLVDAVAKFSCERQDKALAQTLVSALHESFVLDHVGRLLLALAQGPAGQALPHLLTGLQGASYLSLCRARHAVVEAVQLAAARGRELRPEMGSRQVAMILGASALDMVDDLGCGLPHTHLLAMPLNQGGEASPYPCVPSIVIENLLSALMMDVQALVGEQATTADAAWEELIVVVARPLFTEDGNVRMVFSPARAPPGLLETLQGDLVALVETLLRATGEDPSGPEGAVAITLLGDPGTRSRIVGLLAHSPPRKAAAFIATLAKVLRRTSPLVLTHKGHYRTAASMAVATACEVLHPRLRTAASASQEPSGPVDPAAPCSPALVLSLAALRLLPELSRLALEAAVSMLAGTGGARRAPGTGTPKPNPSMEWCFWSMLRAADYAGDVLRSSKTAPVATHRLAAACSYPFLVEEVGLGPLLGALLALVQRFGTVPSMQPASACLDLARTCARLRAAYPGRRWRGDGPGDGGGGGSSNGSGGWQLAALRLVAAEVARTKPALSREVESLAAWLEQPEGVEAPRASGASAAIAVLAERLAALKGEARALLPTCSNPACANLAGDSEAGLKLQRCAGCQDASYCCRECQTAHWRAGHKATCSGKSG